MMHLIQEMSEESIVNMAFIILFGIMTILFILQTTKAKRSAPQFLISLCWGLFGAIIATLGSRDLFPSLNFDRTLILSLQLICYGLQIFSFYLFLENINELQINPYRMMFAFGFLLIQIFALIQIVLYQGSGVTAQIWFFADLGYNVLGVYTYGLFGAKVYYRTFKYTGERKALFLMFAVIIVGLGYITLFMADFFGYFGILNDLWSDIGILGDVFPMLGLLIFVFVYLSDVNYIYRLPNDNYILMVSFKTGEAIHTVKLQTKKQLELEENLLAGLISAVTSIFQTSLQSKHSIKNISNKDATILLEGGENIIVSIVADRVSALLVKALQRYVMEFEKIFRKELHEKDACISHYDQATELLKSIFPFFIVKNS